MGDNPSFAHEFSLLAPDAIDVSLVIFKNVEDSLGIEYPMKKVGDNFVHELPQIKNEFWSLKLIILPKQPIS